MSGRRWAAVAVTLVLLGATASAPLVRYVLPEIVAIAYDIQEREIVYSWGGGHAERPGPSNLKKTRHVGIYLGGGRMMNAPETGAVVRIDDIDRVKGFLGFYRY